MTSDRNLYVPQLIYMVTSAMRTNGIEDYPNLISPYVHVKDLYVSVIIAFILFLFRFILEKHLFPRLFHKLTFKSERATMKLSENLFYTVFYVISFSYGIWVFARENWTESLIRAMLNLEPKDASRPEHLKTVLYELYDGFPPQMSTDLRLYYLSQLGFYVGCLAFLHIDTRRSDYGQYVIHHISTLLLVGASYMIGYVRLGVVILILHDVGDIFLYGAKSIHYMGWGPFDTVVFAVFTVVFYISRLVLLPRVLYSVLVEVFIIAINDPHFNEWLPYWHWYIVHWVVFSGLLTILVLLHCFWYNLILRMVYREITKPGATSEEGDIRSDSEDD